MSFRLSYLKVWGILNKGLSFGDVIDFSLLFILLSIPFVFKRIIQLFCLPQKNKEVNLWFLLQPLRKY